MRRSIRRTADVLGALVLVPVLFTLLPTGGTGLAADDPKAATAGVTRWDIGDPSDEATYLVDLINRARTDPAGEADRIFRDYDSANVRSLVDQFAPLTTNPWTRTENRDAWRSYAPRPPLAINAALTATAHQWSTVMRDRDTAAQSFPDEPGLFTRMAQNGYQMFWAAQLISGFAPDVISAHASWTIDWGQPTDNATGRPALPNRTALINFTNEARHGYVEIGVGVVKRLNPPPGSLGPRVATAAMASPFDATRRFVTGVVYEDKNGNGSYDLGEGFPDVRIDVDTSSFFAISTASGAYSIPVDRLAGDVQVVAQGVPGGRSEIFARQVVVGTTTPPGREVGNVKADFVLQPRTDPPVTTTFDGVGGALPASAAQSFSLDVGAIDPARTTVGDLDVSVDLTHPDRSSLELRLRHPSGLEIPLWDGAGSGADLVGTFDTSLRPVQSLGVFIDAPYEGSWTLTVTDAAGQAGTLNGWSLHVRPRWEGSLHSRRSSLFLTRLKVKDKGQPLRDQIRLSADIETGAPLPADAEQRMELVLRDAGTLDEILRVDLSQPGPGAKRATLTGDVQASLVPSFRGTSRARLTAKVRGIDLPTVPRDVRVELAVGDVFVTEDVRLALGQFKGKRTAPLTTLFRVERIKSRVVAGARKTTVRGRYRERGLDPIPSIVELRVGTATGLFRAGPIVLEENRIEYAPSGNVRKLVLNPVAGTFVAKISGTHELLQDGRTEVSLWLGDYFGSMDVAPRTDGDDIDY